MTLSEVDLRQARAERTRHVPLETWVLLILALSGVLALIWLGAFAWANARAVGLL